MHARLLCMGLLVAGALGLVAAPGAAQINIGITVGTPPPPRLVIPVPPQLVVIPQTQVFYAPARAEEAQRIIKIVKIAKSE